MLPQCCIDGSDKPVLSFDVSGSIHLFSVHRPFQHAIKMQLSLWVSCSLRGQTEKLPLSCCLRKASWKVCEAYCLGFWSVSSWLWTDLLDDAEIQS